MDEVIVIGGGQAGLAMSHELAARDVPHAVLDARPTLGGADATHLAQHISQLG